jgi:ribosomal protein S18 acetylase RimI-like enzyme
MDLGAIRAGAGGMGVSVGALQASDRAAVREIITACGVFTDEEGQVALEVLDAGLAQGLDGDYPLFAATIDGRVCGYVCVGKTPLTRGTWHLYWICVHPRVQGLGVGRALQSYAEAFIRSRGGERLVLETSTTSGYAKARGFYERAGYTRVGLIPDFYKPADDCAIYCKSLASEALK